MHLLPGLEARSQGSGVGGLQGQALGVPQEEGASSSCSFGGSRHSVAGDSTTPVAAVSPMTLSRGFCVCEQMSLFS